MYTLDLECENASHKADNSTRISYLSNGGCNITDLGLDGNLTVGENTSRYKSLETKQYTGMYIGYHNAGLASYYLKRQPLDWSEFNATYFESVLNSGRLEVNARSDAMPGVTIPKYWDVVARTNLTLSSDLMSMVGLAVGTGTRPLEEYLDWQALSKAYADAYRLLFVRAMVDVLGKGDNFSSSKEVAGQRQVVSEAVLLEPVFVHIVVGFLAVVSISTIALLILTFIRQRNLRTDPSFVSSTGQRRDSPSSIAKPVRPVEFSLWVAFPIINLFVALAILLGVLYGKAHANVVLQALRAKHFVLASVCAMALLANLLAVAFSGLFNQVSVDIQHTIALNPTYEPNFVLVNGSVGPLANNNQGTPNLSGAYFGGDGADHFLIAESNITRNTSLPAWTDNAMFYVPVFDEGGNTSHLSTSILEAKTNAIGATLECKEMELGQDFNAHIIDTEGSMNVSIPNGQGSSFWGGCVKGREFVQRQGAFLFRAGAGWHNDTFANDYLNYFIKQLPVPKLEDVLEPLNQVYAKLFAIWFGRNKQDLLVPNQNNESATLYGSRLEPERRLFLSSTMFIISEAILCTYVVVAIWVYTRRPGQYLARMPTSIASIIALFAASTAVEDMQGTSHLDRKERAQHLRRLDSRYGFGSFIGGMDGRVHIGIEKVPLVVKPRAKKTTWLEHKLPLLRKRSVGPSV
ncbi:hypothetical protein SNOG_11230 [Parastagonospora nodorum SN15]|uniref:Uncharacterized protein n=1 Tax=Phaeosphaeria nodorum (strain SN15 / ATCC MYA-4574 / FGSC 10173) TaxID=321614 RepID=Q0UAI4_PHANO|nr:hypothetical protein SNOG_11230 [Parastagonospora nodorum SN15]EAT81729.2 hypothetical protein SNOG_11230 [Parastagonospora nodorum SN15]